MSAPNRATKQPSGLVARHPVATYLVMAYPLGWATPVCSELSGFARPSIFLTPHARRVGPTSLLGHSGHERREGGARPAEPVL
jgi:hypothetical protein